MKRRGWFITMEQDGERTLAEQMLGLGHVLAEVKGKSVADLGCAEGLIAIEMSKAGARRVFGAECIRAHVDAAQPLIAGYSIEVHPLNLNYQEDLNVIRGWRADIMLMLAVLHKLSDPAAALAFLAGATGELAVIRLPHGSEGAFASKYVKGATCDVLKVMPRAGFRLERVERGPRGEKVQYWRRARLGEVYVGDGGGGGGAGAI